MERLSGSRRVGAALESYEELSELSWPDSQALWDCELSSAVSMAANWALRRFS